MKQLLQPLFFAILFFIATPLLQAQVTKGFTHDGLQRSYIVYAPSNYTASKKYPLVLVLHGLTQDGNGIMSYSGFNAIAEANQFIAVYPTGTGFPTNWNASIGASGVNDFGFINALCDTIIKNYNINTARLYSCGFSNGGFLSHMLACQSTRFAAIAAVSGTMTDATYTACTPSKKIPVLQIHGTNDLVVSYTGGTGMKSVADVLTFWTTHNACPTSPTTTALPNSNTTDNSTVDSIEYAPCGSGTRVQHVRINSGGHQWPSALSLSGVGTLNKDINASQMIWNFFNSVWPTGLEQGNTGGAVKLFPNPVSNVLHFGKAMYSIKIIALDGTHCIAAQNANSIDVSQLAHGMYMAQVQQLQGAVPAMRIFEKQ